MPKKLPHDVAPRNIEKERVAANAAGKVPDTFSTLRWQKNDLIERSCKDGQLSVEKRLPELSKRIRSGQDHERSPRIRHSAPSQPSFRVTDLTRRRAPPTSLCRSEATGMRKFAFASRGFRTTTW